MSNNLNELRDAAGRAHGSAQRRSSARVGPADDDAPAAARGPRRGAGDAAADQPRACSSRQRPGGCSRRPPRSSTAPTRTPTMLPGASHPAPLGEGAPRSDRARRRARAGRVESDRRRGSRREANSDFGAFAPYLERNLELARRYVDCFDGFECAYDVLLDDYEPGMKTAEVASLFAELKSELVPLIATVSRATGATTPACTEASRSTTSVSSSPRWSR